MCTSSNIIYILIVSYFTLITKKWVDLNCNDSFKKIRWRTPLYIQREKRVIQGETVLFNSKTYYPTQRSFLKREKLVIQRKNVL